MNKFVHYSINVPVKSAHWADLFLLLFRFTATELVVYHPPHDEYPERSSSWHRAAEDDDAQRVCGTARRLKKLKMASSINLIDGRQREGSERFYIMVPAKGQPQLIFR